LFEWGQRSVPLSLAAEIQHRLLPGSYTCEAGQFTLAGWLEPAGTNAGDTFDFSLERDAVHLPLTDAMGHDVDAAMLATVLVGALRNARRVGHDLQQQAASASKALADHAQRVRHGPTCTRRPAHQHRAHRQRRSRLPAAAARRPRRVGLTRRRPALRVRA
jgi:hypothetical protein